MKKIIKLICWALLILFIFLIVEAIVASGSVGDSAKYYYLKGVHRLFNPKNNPTAEITIDLDQTYDFIKYNGSSNGRLYPTSWWPHHYDGPTEERRALETGILRNSFEYFRIKIILKDTTIIIPYARRVCIRFKDYRRLEYRPLIERGIDSIEILYLEGQPVLENGRMIKYRTDSDFAFSLHEKLVSIFSDPGFVRDPEADEKQKNIVNKRLEHANENVRHLEYKTWEKGDFKFTLILELSLQRYRNGYINTIYISAKDAL